VQVTTDTGHRDVVLLKVFPEKRFVSSVCDMRKYDEAITEKIEFIESRIKITKAHDVELLHGSMLLNFVGRGCYSKSGKRLSQEFNWKSCIKEHESLARNSEGQFDA